MKTYCIFRATLEIKKKGCITGDFDWYIRSLIHTQLEKGLQVIYIISLPYYQLCVFSNKRLNAVRTMLRVKKRIISLLRFATVKHLSVVLLTTEILLKLCNFFHTKGNNVRELIYKFVSNKTKSSTLRL